MATERETAGTDSRDAEVLRARAAELARLPEQATADRMARPALHFLEFGLAGERFAVDTRFVHGLQALTGLTPLPCVPPFVLGILNVRGLIVAVIDLREFLGRGRIGSASERWVLQVGRDDIELGVLVDSDFIVHADEAAALHPLLPIPAGTGSRYLQGVIADRLLLVDMPAVLDAMELVVDEQPDDPPRHAEPS
ncbi:MAG: chemotaxis protein CheW [Burkholderiaceae bacterium]